MTMRPRLRPPAMPGLIVVVWDCTVAGAASSRAGSLAVTQARTIRPCSSHTGKRMFRSALAQRLLSPNGHPQRAIRWKCGREHMRMRACACVLVCLRVSWYSRWRVRACLRACACARVSVKAVRWCVDDCPHRAHVPRTEKKKDSHTFAWRSRWRISQPVPWSILGSCALKHNRRSVQVCVPARVGFPLRCQ